MSFSKHTAVVAAFGKHFAGQGDIPVEMHRYLLDAMTKRGIADYNFELQVSNETVAGMIGHAEKFIEISDRILGDVSEHE